MPELLTIPLIFGKGMAFIGAAPGASYSMVPDDTPVIPRRTVMGTLFVAAAATTATQITIRADDGGQNGG